jgi:hypothetical protein
MTHRFVVYDYIRGIAEPESYFHVLLEIDEVKEAFKVKFLCHFSFFNNSHDTEQSIERQLSERHKLKQKLNKEKVDKFLFKYQRFLEKKDVEVNVAYIAGLTKNCLR